jgi:cobalt-zinc-cadmium efflux system membrane fusion protein
MNKLIISFACLAILLSSCNNQKNKTNDDHHAHEDIGHGALAGSHAALEPLSYTVYTDKLELFVEFKPLVVGEVSKFAAHFTFLGKRFKAVATGDVLVSLVGKGDQPKFRSNEPSSPGIFRLALKPINSGTYDLIFEVNTGGFTDKIVIKDVTVFNDVTSVVGDSSNEINDEISYLKEQAWKVDFATKEVLRGSFSEIIKTTGEILTAQGDEVVVTAKSSGIISFGSNQKQIGSAIRADELLLNISGDGLTEDNLDVKCAEAKAIYDKCEVDFDRAMALVKDKIISQKDFEEVKLKYDNAKTAHVAMSNNYSKSGQQVVSPFNGYIKNLMVIEGQYVEIGQPIAKVAQNKRLMLKAEVPQKHFSKLSSITSANFKTAYDDEIYSTDSLNGKLISYGKNTSDNSFYIPVNFEIDNKGDLISGSFIELFLKARTIGNSLYIPLTSVMEEQGNYYAYVQTSGEGFQKRVLKLGANDGVNVVVLSGIQVHERVVTTGGYSIKLTSMSGTMPAHGHEH